MPPVILGPLCLLLTVLLAAGLGRRLLRWLRFEPGEEAGIIIKFSLGLGALQWIPFLLLAGGIGTPGVVRLAIIVTGVVLIPDIIGACREAGRVIAGWGRPRWWELALLGIVLLLLALVFLRSLLPETNSDVLSYHLTAPLRYFAEGKFIHLLTITPTNWPMGIELLYGVLLVFHEEAPIAVIPFLLGLTIISLVYLYARRKGGRPGGAVAVVLLLLIPVLWWEMTTGMIDLGTALFALLTLYILDTSDGEPSSLILVALFAGLAATTKLQGMWIIPSFAIIIFLREYQNGMARSVRRALSFTLLASLVVAPWYLKTWILTGNPAYPLLYDLFGGTELTSEGSQRYAYVYKLVDANHDLPPSVSRTPIAISLYYYLRIVFCVLIASLVIRFSRLTNSATLLAFICLFTTFVCIGSSVHVRFLLPAYVAGSVALSLLARHWPERFMIPVCAAAFLLAGSIEIRRLKPEIGLSMSVITGQTGRTEYSETHGVREIRVAQFANEHLPEESRILLGSDDEHTALHRHVTFWANSWLQDSFHYDSQDRLIFDLRRMSVTHLLLDGRFPAWQREHLVWKERFEVEHPALITIAQRYGRTIFSDGEVVLYELTLPADTEGDAHE